MIFWFERLIYDIKTEIKDELRIELYNNLENRLFTLSNDFKTLSKLEKMSDKDIIKHFKHSKFNEVSTLIQNFLCERYKFNILNSNFCSVSDLTKVYPNSYIADAIEKYLKTKEYLKSRYEVKEEVLKNE